MRTNLLAEKKAKLIGTPRNVPVYARSLPGDMSVELVLNDDNQHQSSSEKAQFKCGELIEIRQQPLQINSSGRIRRVMVDQYERLYMVIDLKRIGDHERFPIEYTPGFRIGVGRRPIDVMYDRMIDAVNVFASGATDMDESIAALILGRTTTQHEIVGIDALLPAVPNQPQLHWAQLTALRESLRRPITLIQGPPGTGKTVTATAIVYHLAVTLGERVLVSAPSNVAGECGRLVVLFSLVNLVLVNVGHTSWRHTFFRGFFVARMW